MVRFKTLSRDEAKRIISAFDNYDDVMEKAKQMLQKTTMKNYEIAEKVGFSDPHYFGIAFKKATGMSPKEYAKGRKS